MSSCRQVPKPEMVQQAHHGQSLQGDPPVTGLVTATIGSRLLGRPVGREPALEPVTQFLIGEGRPIDRKHTDLA